MKNFFYIKLFLITFLISNHLYAYYVRNEANSNNDVWITVQNKSGLVTILESYQKLEIPENEFPVTVRYYQLSGSGCEKELKLNHGCHTISGDVAPLPNKLFSCYPMHHVNWCPWGDEKAPPKTNMGPHSNKLRP